MKKYLLLLIMLAMSLPAAFAAMEITPEKAKATLLALDDSIAHRIDFVNRRQRQINHYIDLLQRKGPSEAVLLAISEQYAGFNNDSALHYLDMGLRSDACPDKLPFALGRAQLLPLSGLFTPAIEIYTGIDTADVPPERRPLYYDCGRQMYSYMAAFSAGDREYREQFTAKSMECQRRLLEVLPQESLSYKYNLGEYYFFSGAKGRARAMLEYVIENANGNNSVVARAAHHLSSIARAEGDSIAYVYYLSRACIADLSAATREMAALQELGSYLYTRGDVDRAYTYLTEALASAVECGAPLRMIESSRSLPIIENAKTDQIKASQRSMIIVLVILGIVVMVLAITMVMLRREMRNMRTMEDNLRRANSTKEVYISQFLSLCSIYMDKLNQFCKIANRKIASGNVDELYRLTKSGKFVEEQSRDFYEVFDNAFLHIYPTFVAQVNALLLPDKQIELKDGERLNTDLRILAFMRLGIEESSRIAQVLNYSLNTIYAYRNRTKARAINRDTFEEDVMKIQAEY